MPQLEGFGALSRLPPEIRIKIWEYLSLTTYQKPPILCGQKLAILGSSRAIYTEAYVEVHRDVIIRFVINGDFIRSKHDFPNKNNNYGLTSNIASRELPENLWTSYPLDPSFRKLPFEKIRRIELNIEAPSQGDPGQLVHILDICLRLAGTLQQQHPEKSLAHLEIRLTDVLGHPNVNQTWMDCRDNNNNNEPRATLSHYCQVHNDGDAPRQISSKIIQRLRYDYWMVFNALSGLRASSAEIILPQDLWVNIEARVATQNMVQILEGKKGTDPDWNLEMIKQRRLFLVMDLDIILDVLKCRTAEALRRVRFATWYKDGSEHCSYYEKRISLAVKRYYDVIDVSDILWHLRRRYSAMRVYNPWGKVYFWGIPNTWDRENEIPLSWIGEDGCYKQTDDDSDDDSEDEVDSVSKQIEEGRYKLMTLRDAFQRGFYEDVWDEMIWEKEKWGFMRPAKPINPLDKGVHVQGAVIGLDYDDEYHRTFAKRVKSWEDYITCMRHLGIEGKL